MLQPQLMLTDYACRLCCPCNQLWLTCISFCGQADCCNVKHIELGKCGVQLKEIFRACGSLDFFCLSEKSKVLYDLSSSQSL